jgi:glycosyltransferase involved in cell wall biosynthesis
MPRDRSADPACADPLCTVLIPAYNEAGTIREIVEAVLAHVDRVLVVSDGSTDGTVAQLAGLPVEVLEHPDNRGKGRRLAEGLDRAFRDGAECVLTLDADGQHDPSEIPAFLAAARRFPESLIVGDRLGDRRSMPAVRAASIGLGDFFISWATGRRLRDCQCGMRLYPAELWARIKVPDSERHHFVFETAVLLRAAEAGGEIARVPIAARYAGFVQRPSRFRPVVDTLRIAGQIARFILGGRARPKGLLIALGLLR